MPAVRGGWHGEGPGDNSYHVENRKTFMPAHNVVQCGSALRIMPLLCYIARLAHKLCWQCILLATLQTVSCNRSASKAPQCVLLAGLQIFSMNEQRSPFCATPVQKLGSIPSRSSMAEQQMGLNHISSCPSCFALLAWHHA
jgi:hypothetical protein